MREENYFEIKLRTCEETLASAQSKLEHLDIQIKNLELRFEHDKKIYNDQAIHMQNIIVDMKKRIPKLKKRIAKGYIAYDIRTDKGYKSYKDLHEAKLEAKRQEAIDNYNAAKAKIEKRKALLESKKPRSPEEKEILVAAELQKEDQPEHEVKASQEKQLEDLKRKREFYEAELAKLGHEIEKEVVDNKITFIEDQFEPKDSPLEIGTMEIPVKINKEVKPPEITPVETTIEERTEVSKALRGMADTMNGETAEIQWLERTEAGKRMMVQYSELEGGHAIWRGTITKGFREFCKIQGYTIGE